MKLYVYLFVILAFLSIGIVALFYRGNAIAATAQSAALSKQLNDVIEVNRQQQLAINNITAMRQAVDNINREMNEQFENINQNIINQNDEITALKESNQDVKAFLNIAIPPDIIKLRNKAAGNN